MSRRVIITLPNEVYRRAECLAQLTSRAVAEILVDTITLSLPSLSLQSTSIRDIRKLSDEEVLSLTELQMEPDQDRKLSVLLQKQQAGELSDRERSELWTLMQIYQERLLRKAQALREAVRRGLRALLEP